MMSSTPRTFVGSSTFEVIGMTCGHCERAVSREIGLVRGVHRVDVDLPSGRVDEAGYALVP